MNTLDKYFSGRRRRIRQMMLDEASSRHRGNAAACLAHAAYWRVQQGIWHVHRDQHYRLIREARAHNLMARPLP
jgi:hypothetical protein